jgi:starvation-inducible DNA-binding protein
MKPVIELSDNNLQEVANILNTLLADEYVLFTKTLNAHWNVQGANFMELHKFFQMQYDELYLLIDNTAERIRSLGHFAAGSLKNFLSNTHLLEDSSDFGNPKQILETLINDHETIIRYIRNELPKVMEINNDMGSADFMTGIMMQHEKMTWMLRAHIV